METGLDAELDEELSYSKYDYWNKIPEIETRRFFLSKTIVHTSDGNKAINVLAYDVPAISELSLARCNEDGTANPSGGAYLRAAFTATVTARADADQTLTTTSATTVSMTYVRWATPGTDSYLQLADGGIECKVTGFVEVSGRVMFSSGYTDGRHLRGGIYQNSSYQLSCSVHASTTASYHTAVIPPAVLQVSAGDIIYLKALGDDGVVVGYEGAQHATTLTVKYIG